MGILFRGIQKQLKPCRNPISWVMTYTPKPQLRSPKGSGIVRRCNHWSILLSAAAALMFALPCLAAPSHPAVCTRVAFDGLVNAGQEWRTPLGEGWVFRVLPIVPGPHGYTGWDLVVDRVPPAGFPDALLLATPPYNSINDREIGTTFGLRAQDAIGWNPRSFHFLANPAAFLEGQKLFVALLNRLHALAASSQKPDSDPEVERLTHQLMSLRSHSASGELRILDAGLAPGTADPASYAQNWAHQAAYMSYTMIPQSGFNSSPLGELGWMHFSLTLWLPSGWKLPGGVSGTSAACPE